MTTNPTTDATARSDRAGDGDARWWWGNLAILKTTGEQTRGGLTVVEVTMGPARTAPPHVHHREDETFLVTRGQVTFQIGEQTIDAGEGDLVVGPRDLPHSFAAGPDGATLLFLLTPAGLEGLILDQSVPATRHALPRPGEVPPPDIGRMREIALEYGCELLV